MQNEYKELKNISERKLIMELDDNRRSFQVRHYLYFIGQFHEEFEEIKILTITTHEILKNKFGGN